MDRSWARVLTRAESQYGLITVTQAAEIGVAEHRIRYATQRGRLEVVQPGVLRIAGSTRSWQQRAKAATLWLGDAALSHGSSSRMSRLDHPRRDDIHVCILNGATKGRRAHGVIIHRSLRLPDAHRVFIDGIPCTSAARTVLDLADSLRYEDFVAMAESARRLGLMSLSELERTMEQCGPRRHGRATVRRYLEAHDGKAVLEHRLEVRTAALLERHGLGGFRGQYRVTVGDGSSHRVDFAWPRWRVIVECDGFRWHGNHAAWKRDRRRIAALEHAGWRVLIVTWDDVARHPRETVDRIRAALC